MNYVPKCDIKTRMQIAATKTQTAATTTWLIKHPFNYFTDMQF